MAWNAPQGPFDIPDIPNYIPRRLKPWLFIFFVLIIQFSGGLYLAAASDMVGTTALMQEDILMAGYASLIGLSINFAVMFRIKFRFSNRTQLLAAGAVLIAANWICASGLRTRRRSSRQGFGIEIRPRKIPLRMDAKERRRKKDC